MDCKEKEQTSEYDQELPQRQTNPRTRGNWDMHRHPHSIKNTSKVKQPALPSSERWYVQ